jgi:4-alpha-glucanotransferase
MNGQPDADAWGIEPGYHDVAGTWHPVPDDTRDALLAALGADRPEPPGAPVWVVRTGEAHDIGAAAVLLTEDGDERPLDRYLPADLSPGYHELHHVDGGHCTRLIASPGRCPRPPQMWGWAAQLATLRSARSWGMGDLADLRDLGHWARGIGAGFTLVSPIGAPRMVAPLQASPYSPSSRRWRNPLHLCVEGLDGVDEIAVEQGRARSDRPLVDRDDVWAVKRAALEEAFATFHARADTRPFEAWRAMHGDDLATFALHTTLDEVGAPRPFPAPGSPAAARLAREHPARVRFHEWLQWLADTQLGEAGSALPIVTDLPVGFDPEGADAWAFHDTLLPGEWRIGAPPDDFNPNGQDWGLPPFDPWRLRAAAYEPFIKTVRAALAHAGGLRVDHVMGLFRLFIVPVEGGPAAGAYLRYPWWDLLEILCLEASRAGAWIVGEDLGTVEPWVRQELANRHILSTKVLWFEPEPPLHWPEDALAAATTHDLPTAAGLWTGADTDDQRAAGVTPDYEAWNKVRSRVREWCGLGEHATATEFVQATYRLLAQSPAIATAATLEDALGVERRPNLPGTLSDARPNWSIPLPRRLEELEDDAGVAAVAAVLSARTTRVDSP